MRHVVIIGAGQAGAACAAKLRALKLDGDITMIGDEPSPPYQRPPLSKAYLLGDIEQERLWLRSTEFWAEHRIDLRLGQPISAIDTSARQLQLGDERLSYDELVLATGSAPRHLPAAIGGDLDGVFTVRTLADVDRMRADLPRMPTLPSSAGAAPMKKAKSKLTTSLSWSRPAPRSP